MLVLRTLAPWLLMAFLGQQVCLSSGGRGVDRSAAAAPGRAQRSGDKGATTGRGKFSTKDNMQCTWTAKDATDSVRVLVKCENPVARIRGGVTDMKCDYNGKPQRCPGYQSDPKGFWKQVGRAFKRLQGKTCKDERALVKAGMCKRAPREAHFKLDIVSSVVAAQSGGEEATPPPRTTSTTTLISTSTRATNCTRADHQKTAEEYCSSRWASVCSFFFSILQNEDC